MDVAAMNAPSTLGGGLTKALGGTNALDKEAFLRLLVTQLSNQSPLDPVSNEDFVAQLAQFSALESAQASNERLGSILDLERLGQGAELVGRRVTYLDPASGERLPGTVSAVEIVGGAVIVDLGGERVPIQNIVRIDGSEA